MSICVCQRCGEVWEAPVGDSHTRHSDLCYGSQGCTPGCPEQCGPIKEEL